MKKHFLIRTSHREELRREHIKKQKRLSTRDRNIEYFSEKYGHVSNKTLERWHREVNIYFEQVTRSKCLVFKCDNPYLEHLPPFYGFTIWWKQLNGTVKRK